MEIFDSFLTFFFIDSVVLDRLLNYSFDSIDAGRDVLLSRFYVDTWKKIGEKKLMDWILWRIIAIGGLVFENKWTFH